MAGDSYRSEFDDRGILARLRSGDQQAWNHLVDRYSRLVWSIPLNFGLNRDDAADIAQIAFSELLVQIDNIRDETRLGPWLATVARRQTWRRVERSRREVVRDLAPEASTDDVRLSVSDRGAIVADETDRVETMLWIDTVVSQLNERCRALIQAMYLSGTEPDYDEISATLGIPVGSIGPTRARCLARMERLLRLGDNGESK